MRCPAVQFYKNRKNTESKRSEYPQGAVRNMMLKKIRKKLLPALLDKPTIVWDFHSLLLGVQMMFSFMLTDSENPIKLCRHYTKAFVASRPSAVFCSPQCKNKHNVYKSRARKNNLDRKEQGND